MKTILLLILSAFTASAATTYPVMTDNANRTFSGGATNLALLNGTNTLTGPLAVSSSGVAVDVTVGSVRSFSAIRANFLNTYDNGASIIANPLDYVQIYNGAGGNAIRILSGGDVGVGTTSPSAQLHVVGSGLKIGSSGASITSILSATATLNFDLTALVVEDKTITVTGAGDGDVVTVGVPNGSITATVQFTGWVSATNTVTIRARTSVVGEDPASGIFRATVIRH